ncbi:replication protein [Cronobacter sakazakii]|uniref:replication protein n=1 Tax=Cronobacter sakazakii TaxID=28141 RepID=UPI000CFBFB0F|nr:replication protein [Cronobacter sakazakii]ELY2629364.1 replication protein [Cronobacter sakazakii]ELY2637657.1 replication protein [Cronobacter sakazakii]ELY2659642.1 replication protein [Cronobacter sakazakii]ELY4636289.1 replication protein [Cronobacter sakazakii]ELY4783835.1 replication protein [Cronobacter sakazakii]
MGEVAYVDFGAEQQPVELKVADLDDGYARLSNMLLAEYAGADLTKRQFKVLLAILRKTYGWNKPMDRVTDAQIAEIAKLPVKRCNEAKLELVRMGVIKQQGGMFGPNPNVYEWNIPRNEGKSLKMGDIPQTEGKSPKTGNKKSLKMRVSNPSKQGNTKDTIQNTKNNTPLTPQVGKGRFNPLDVDLPDWLDPAVWREWVQYRAESKKPIKSMLTVTKAIKLLSQFRDSGDNPAEVINQSIANGWQGLFRVKATGRALTPVNADHVPHWNSPEAWEDVL